MDGLLHQRGGLLHFLQTDVHRAGDVDEDALGPLDRSLQQGAGNGHTGGFLVQFPLRRPTDGKAGIRTGVHGLQIRQQPPCRQHGGAAVGHEGEGHAGEGQKIHGAEHIQAGLKHQQRACRAGGDGIKAGSASPGGANGEPCQGQDAGHRQQRDNQPPFLA